MTGSEDLHVLCVNIPLRRDVGLRCKLARTESAHGHIHPHIHTRLFARTSQAACGRASGATRFQRISRLMVYVRANTALI
jgi:hypothetical protein